MPKTKSVRTEKIKSRERAYYLANRDKKLAYQKDWVAKNRDKTAVHKMKYNYGISKEEFDILVQEQGGKCKICETLGELHIDHDHRSGNIRGLLCGNCNRGIGMFKDNTTLMAKAIEYLG